MRTYWNPQTGETINSPRGGYATKLRRNGWQYTNRYGYSNAYKWGVTGFFYLVKINNEYHGLLINKGSTALQRQAAIGEFLTQKGVSLTGKEFGSLYQDRRVEKGNLRLNKSVANICLKNKLENISYQELSVVLD